MLDLCEGAIHAGHDAGGDVLDLCDPRGMLARDALGGGIGLDSGLRLRALDEP
jgi:hypothetical protein